MEIFGLMSLGLFLGMTHAMDADHIATVSAMWNRQAWINAAGGFTGVLVMVLRFFGTLRGSVVNWAGFKRTEAGLAGTRRQFADSISWLEINLADVSSPYPYSYP